MQNCEGAILQLKALALIAEPSDSLQKELEFPSLLCTSGKSFHSAVSINDIIVLLLCYICGALLVFVFGGDRHLTHSLVINI